MVRERMTRPETWGITQALINLLSTIDISVRQDETTLMPVGWGEAPDKPYPYMVVSGITGPPGEGPLDDTQADVEDHLQITSLSDMAEIADRIRDKGRAIITPVALQEQLDSLPVEDATKRRIMRVELELSNQTIRADRGLPEPVFHAVDQILVHSTPA